MKVAKSGPIWPRLGHDRQEGQSRRRLCPCFLFQRRKESRSAWTLW